VPMIISQIYNQVQESIKVLKPWKPIHSKEMLLYTRFVVERLQRGESLSSALQNTILQAYSVDIKQIENVINEQGGGTLPNFSTDLTIKKNTVSPTNCPHLLE